MPMRNILSHLPFSPLTLIASTAVVLAVVYIGLIAVVMNYAAVTIEFSQSVRDDESTVAALETQYLSAIAQVTNTNYIEAGYAKPIATLYVPAASVTALR